jgi:hypothetical protein
MVELGAGKIKVLTSQMARESGSTYPKAQTLANKIKEDDHCAPSKSDIIDVVEQIQVSTGEGQKAPIGGTARSRVTLVLSILCLLLE